MGISTGLIKKDSNSTPDIQKLETIENHKATASHLLAAATHHFKAANYLKQGNYERAAESALLAQEYLNLASVSKREDMKQGIFNNEIVI